jgi:hypothetical protein
MVGGFCLLRPLAFSKLLSFQAKRRDSFSYNHHPRFDLKSLPGHHPEFPEISTEARNEVLTSG